MTKRAFAIALFLVVMVFAAIGYLFLDQLWPTVEYRVVNDLRLEPYALWTVNGKIGGLIMKSPVGNTFFLEDSDLFKILRIVRGEIIVKASFKLKIKYGRLTKKPYEEEIEVINFKLANASDEAEQKPPGRTMAGGFSQNEIKP